MPSPQAITDFIFLQDAPRPCDVILIPGCSHPELPEFAARPYREGYAPLLLPSGRFSIKREDFPSQRLRGTRYEGTYPTEFDFLRRVLTDNGVPDSAILREDRAAHTLENAFFSRQALDAAGLRVHTAIVCCQAFHARRAFLSYARAFPEARLLTVPVETQGISRDSWFAAEEGRRRVCGELERCRRYFGETPPDFS